MYTPTHMFPKTHPGPDTREQIETGLVTDFPGYRKEILGLTGHCQI